MLILKSLFLSGKVKIKTWVEHYSRLRSVYKYEIFNEQGELATTGSTELICIKEDTFKPIRLDRYFPDWHEAYHKVSELNEAGTTFEVVDGIESL